MSGDAPIPSTLDVKPGGGASGGAALPEILALAEKRAEAAARLQLYRTKLCGQANLINACDLICGEELAPREAAANEREAGKLEAVLLVALDILAGGAAEAVKRCS